VTLDLPKGFGKLTSMNINYHEGGHKVREAYFKFRNTAKYVKHPSVVSFTAGYNAALADIKANASKLTEPESTEGRNHPFLNSAQG